MSKKRTDSKQNTIMSKAIDVVPEVFIDAILKMKAPKR
jgi:hypothetical protein